jgi:uncharacterized protein
MTIISHDLPHTKKNRHLMKAAIVILLFIIFLGGLYPINPEATITAGFGFLFGYIFQRSRFCFAAAFRDVFMIRNTILSRAVLLTVTLTMIGFALVHFVKGEALPAGGIIYPVGLHTAVGGLIFGFGMVIAGNCVSGCLMRMGEGYLMQWLTFAGILLGSAIGAWHLGWWDWFAISWSPVIFLPDYIGWFLALALNIFMALGFYYLACYYQAGWHKIKIKLAWRNEAGSACKNLIKTIFSTSPLSYSAGAVGLAIANTMLFYFWGRPWAITGGITHFVGWLSMKAGFSASEWYYFQKLMFDESKRIFIEHPLIYLAGAMIVGSLFASLLSGEFRLRFPKSTKFSISALIGGFLLGYGSRVALGCNIGGFLGGVASLSLHGWFLGLFMLCGAYLGGKFFLRYLI